MDKAKRFKYETENFRECNKEYKLIFRLIKDSIRRKKSVTKNYYCVL